MTTGISAEERCNTMRALANPNAGAADFVRPGHVFPLIAREGGVLMRSGHTEAAVDLCRLAGLEPVGVLAELVNDDGTVKRGAEVAAFADEHGLRLVSVADLIAWRQRSEKLVERVGEFAGRHRCRPGARLRLSPALRPDPAPGPGLRRYRRRPRRAGAPAPRVGDRGRVRRRQRARPRSSSQLAERRPRRHRLSARGLGRRRRREAGARATPPRPRRECERRRARTNGARSASAPRSCATSASTRSACIASRERHYVGLDGFGIAIEATEILDH